MCGIFASFDKDKLKELQKLNSYRGSQAYSLCEFWRLVPNSSHQTAPPIIPSLLYKSEGSIPETLYDTLYAKKGSYVVGHIQAPTTQSGGTHPAACGRGMMWHNGIIKQKELEEGEWDTLWLLKKLTGMASAYDAKIMPHDFDCLSNVDGTFACVLFRDDQLFVFRNEISPLFIDHNLNISSTKFDGCQDLPPNKVFQLNLETKWIEEINTFRTFKNPYFFLAG